MNTHESYVSLETAKMLKEAGFDWEEHYPRNFCYVNDSTELFDKSVLKNYTTEDDIIYLAPTLAVAQKWLREMKKQDILPTKVIEAMTLPSGPGRSTEHWKESFYVTPACLAKGIEGNEHCRTYEESLELGIQKCLTALLEEQHENK